VLGGDISNDTPRTIMIHIDVLLKEVEIPPKFFAGVLKPKKVKRLDLLQANRLWLTAMEIRPSLECFITRGYDTDKNECKELDYYREELERHGLDCFRWYMPYEDVEAVVKAMAYRPTLMGVVDITERGLRYGSYFIPFDSLVKN
jgi:hypothetical protein